MGTTAVAPSGLTLSQVVPTPGDLCGDGFELFLRLYWVIIYFQFESENVTDILLTLLALVFPF